ncbi:MAG: hypothetical protein L0I24_10305, partial [Pseudonocardia sp.]|nr:hypothetical protein [Pseudonocardia sp.]
MTSSRAAERHDPEWAPRPALPVPPTRSRSPREAALSMAAEVVTAFGAAVLAVQLSRSIVVDPL